MTFDGVMSLTFSPKVPVSNGALQGISSVIRWSRGIFWDHFCFFGQLPFWPFLDSFYLFLRSMSVECWKLYRKNRLMDSIRVVAFLDTYIFEITLLLPDHILTLKMTIVVWPWEGQDNFADLQLLLSVSPSWLFSSDLFGHVTYRCSTKWPMNLTGKIAYYVIGWVISVKSIGGKWLRHGLNRYAKWMRLHLDLNPKSTNTAPGHFCETPCIVEARWSRNVNVNNIK